MHKIMVTEGEHFVVMIAAIIGKVNTFRIPWTVINKNWVNFSFCFRKAPRAPTIFASVFSFP